MKALFCGSFNPVTNGHLDVIRRATALCDTLYVAVMNNVNKQYAISLENRLMLMNKATASLPKVKVVAFEGAVCDFCATYGIDVIVKSGRNALDLQYEMDMADVNKDLCGIETIYLAADSQYRAVSSSFVRELVSLNKDVSQYVPSVCLKQIVDLLRGNN